jgi:hypothetical protein
MTLRELAAALLFAAAQSATGFATSLEDSHANNPSPSCVSALCSANDSFMAGTTSTSSRG